MCGAYELLRVQGLGFSRLTEGPFRVDIGVPLLVSIVPNPFPNKESMSIKIFFPNFLFHLIVRCPSFIWIRMAEAHLSYSLNSLKGGCIYSVFIQLTSIVAGGHGWPHRRSLDIRGHH